MNYITTNIRIPEADYLRLKQEAAQKRISLSAVIREKIKTTSMRRSPEEVAKIIAETNKLGKKLGQRLKGFDSVKAIREMRDNHKW